MPELQYQETHSGWRVWIPESCLLTPQYRVPFIHTTQTYKNYDKRIWRKILNLNIFPKNVLRPRTRAHSWTKKEEKKQKNRK